MNLIRLMDILLVGGRRFVRISREEMSGWITIIRLGIVKVGELG